MSTPLSSLTVMGNDQSAPVSLDPATKGYHVLEIRNDSPAEHAGLQPYFDFIVAVNDVPLEDEGDSLTVAVKENVDGKVNLTVFNGLSQELRVVALVPQWWGNPEDGLVGCTIRFVAYAGASEHVWHVLRVSPDSPASEANLVPDQDFIVGSLDLVYYEASEFYDDLAEHANTSEPIRLLVFRKTDFTVRKVALRPRSWSGEGLLGCELGYGALHKIHFMKGIDVRMARDDHVAGTRNSQLDCANPCEGVVSGESVTVTQNRATSPPPDLETSRTETIPSSQPDLRSAAGGEKSPTGQGNPLQYTSAASETEKRLEGHQERSMGFFSAALSYLADTIAPPPPKEALARRAAQKAPNTGSSVNAVDSTAPMPDTSETGATTEPEVTSSELLGATVGERGEPISSKPHQETSAGESEITGQGVPSSSRSFPDFQKTDLESPRKPDVPFTQITPSSPVSVEADAILKCEPKYSRPDLPTKSTEHSDDDSRRRSVEKEVFHLMGAPATIPQQHIDRLCEEEAEIAQALREKRSGGSYGVGSPEESRNAQMNVVEMSRKGPVELNFIDPRELVSMGLSPRGQEQSIPSQAVDTSPCPDLAPPRPILPTPALSEPELVGGALSPVEPPALADTAEVICSGTRHSSSPTAEESPSGLLRAEDDGRESCDTVQQVPTISSYENSEHFKDFGEVSERRPEGVAAEPSPPSRSLQHAHECGFRSGSVSSEVESQRQILGDAKVWNSGSGYGQAPILPVDQGASFVSGPLSEVGGAKEAGGMSGLPELSISRGRSPMSTGKTGNGQSERMEANGQRRYSAVLSGETQELYAGQVVSSASESHIGWQQPELSCEASRQPVKASFQSSSASVVSPSNPSEGVTSSESTRQKLSTTNPFLNSYRPPQPQIAATNDEPSNTDLPSAGGSVPWSHPATARKVGPMKFKEAPNPFASMNATGQSFFDECSLSNAEHSSSVVTEVGPPQDHTDGESVSFL